MDLQQPQIQVVPEGDTATVPKGHDFTRRKPYFTPAKRVFHWER